MSNVESRALLLFDRYAEMPAEEREQHLESLQKEDPKLHAELVTLLRADMESNSRLDRAPIETIASILLERESQQKPDECIGKMLGNWRIVGVIGRGGMGSVYRVERADGQYHQSAALKYVRADLSSPELVEAFLDERDVLASLTHPDIVPLLDGGIDAQGYPWFVMQLVEGDPISSWCNRRRLSIRERVTLFVDACDAVAYAHARGTLHQDLKPSNMLITPEGRPQLLDFGLSLSLTNPRPESRKRLAMTAGYTPPEVLQGRTAGFGIDIYALGVVLYQLLCGRFPVRLNALRHDPMPPSGLAEKASESMLTERGATNCSALTRQLKGELDAIALRSVATDPDARYPSVESLQDDLRAWLSGRPVAAYRQDLGYRFGCLLRRNRGIAILGGILALTIVIMLMLWGWQTWRAQQEAMIANEVDHVLETALGIATLSGLGDIPLVPEDLLDDTEKVLRERAREERTGSAEALARGISILARNRAMIGDYRKAEALAREAQENGSQDSLQAAFNTATLAQIQSLRAKYDEAEQTVRVGLASLPLRLTDQHELAWVRLQSQLAVAQSGQGRSREAFETLQAAITQARRLTPAISDAVVARLLIQRGTWYRWRVRVNESEADLVRAIELTEVSDPIIADDARESLVRTVRAARKSGREARALALARQLLHSRQKTLGERHVQTGQAWAELVFMQMLSSDYTAAQESLEQAQEILQPVVGAEHPAMARVYAGRALHQVHNGKVAEAMASAERARSIYERRHGPAHEFTLEARYLLANLYWSQASMTGDKGGVDKALLTLEAAIRDAERAHGTVAATNRVAYAQLLEGVERKEEARRQLAQARADTLWQYGKNSQEMLGVQLAECMFMVEEGSDPATTGTALDRLIADAASVDTLYAIAIAHTAWLVKGRWLQNRQQFDKARTSYRHARKQAERAGHQGWIAVAERRLRELKQVASATDKSARSP